MDRITVEVENHVNCNQIGNKILMIIFFKDAFYPKISFDSLNIDNYPGGALKYPFLLTRRLIQPSKYTFLFILLCYHMELSR